MRKLDALDVMVMFCELEFWFSRLEIPDDDV